jgi:DNA-binding PadR family transcriptional regulator
MQELSPTAKVILGFLRLGARNGYEIKSAVEVSTRFFWGASFGQIYPELRRLEATGLVQSADDPQGARARRAYRLTRAGERALDAWLRSPEERLFAYRDEGLLKFFFGDLLPRRDVLDGVRATRAQFESALRFFREELAPRALAGREEGSEFPYLALEFGIALLAFIAEWWAETENRLEQGLAE